MAKLHVPGDGLNEMSLDKIRSGTKTKYIYNIANEEV
jgi:hypothetical protein